MHVSILVSFHREVPQLTLQQKDFIVLLEGFQAIDRQLPQDPTDLTGYGTSVSMVVVNVNHEPGIQAGVAESVLTRQHVQIFQISGSASR